MVIPDSVSRNKKNPAIRILVQNLVSLSLVLVDRWFLSWPLLIDQCLNRKPVTQILVEKAKYAFAGKWSLIRGVLRCHVLHIPEQPCELDVSGISGFPDRIIKGGVQDQLSQYLFTQIH